jgi:sRNA-binding carbon storage regulator CsrA
MKDQTNGKLVFTVKDGLGFTIGDNIYVHVARAEGKGKQFKVLISAPKYLRVERMKYASGNKIQDEGTEGAG